MLDCRDSLDKAKPKARDKGNLFYMRIEIMRQIKFRAWDVENQEMIDSDSLAFDYYEPLCDQLCDSDEMKFMQFTGFQDSKGSDIYEGDIIYVAGFSRKAKAIISHKHGSEFEDLDGYHRSMINAAAENDIGEIIGNIHQNPELLEQNDE